MPNRREHREVSPQRSDKLSMRQLQDFVYKTKARKNRLPDANIDESIVHMTDDTHFNPIVTADELSIGDIVYNDNGAALRVEDIIGGNNQYKDIVFIDLSTNKAITRTVSSLSLFELSVEGDTPYEINETFNNITIHCEDDKMKINKLMEAPQNEVSTALNEGPFDKLFKKTKGFDGGDEKERRAAEKVMKQENTLEGKRWSYYVDGKKVNHADYIKLDDVTRQSAVVVDENGYFIRRGTEVLKGQKKVASVDVASGNLTGDSAKVSASHRGTGKAAGSPDQWKFKLGDEMLTLPDYEALDDDEKADVLIIDVKGNEVDKNSAKAVIDRYNSRVSDADHAKEVKDTHRSSAKAMKKADGKGTTLTFAELDQDGKPTVTYSVKEYKKLPTAQRKKLVAIYQSGDTKKQYTYDQLRKIPQMKKQLKLEDLSESLSHRYDNVDDDALVESYTLSKSGVDYDDDFDASTFDAKYDINYNIDDDFD